MQYVGKGIILKIFDDYTNDTVPLFSLVWGIKCSQPFR